MKTHCALHFLLLSKPPLCQRIFREEFEKKICHLGPAGLTGMYAVADEVIALPFQVIGFASLHAVCPQVGTPEKKSGLGECKVRRRP